MRFGAYVLLMFSIILVFYLMGYQSGMMELYEQQQSVTTENGSIDIPLFLAGMAESALAPQNLISLVIVAIAAAATTLVLGYAAIYIIPIAMLIFVINFVVFPFSFVIDPTMPDIIRIPVTIFFNLLTMLGILSFIRGVNV